MANYIFNYMQLFILHYLSSWALLCFLIYIPRHCGGSLGIKIYSYVKFSTHLSLTNSQHMVLSLSEFLLCASESNQNGSSFIKFRRSRSFVHLLPKRINGKISKVHRSPQNKETFAKRKAPFQNISCMINGRKNTGAGFEIILHKWYLLRF